MKKETTFVKEVILTEQFDNEFITKQKLQEYYDLLVLRKKHPEFTEDITMQLHKIATTTKIVTDEVHIDNLQLIQSKKMSDSVNHVNIRYTKLTKFKKETDTITVAIYTNQINLNGQKLTATKITFID